MLSAAGLALWSLASHCCRTRAMAVEGAPCLGQLRSPSLAFHDISVFRMNCRTLPRDSFRCQPVLSAPVGLPCCQCSGFTLCIRFVTCAVKVAAKMCGQRNFTFPNHDGCRCDLCRFTSSARGPHKSAGGRPRDSDPTNLALAISVASHRRRGSEGRHQLRKSRRGITRRNRLLAVNGIPTRTWHMRSSSWPSTGSSPDLAHAIFFTSYDP